MLTIILIILGVLALSALALLGISFYYYVQALKEAYHDGWDMPN